MTDEGTRDQLGELLQRWLEGQPEAREALVPIVYQELRQMARSQMAKERSSHTLQPTALVHEAYLRLVGSDASFESRAHFFGAAAEAMRRILVEHARARSRLKRRGDAPHVEFDERDVGAEARARELVALSEALDDLDRLDPTMAMVVKLKYFGGLSNPEIAELTETSVRTVDRRWARARAWLYRAMHADDHDAP